MVKNKEVIKGSESNLCFCEIEFSFPARIKIRFKLERRIFYVNINIGEWRRRYTTNRFGYVVCDGTQWELEFEYNNDQRPVRFNGDNSYPYNFNKFQMLFGIDNSCEDE